MNDAPLEQDRPQEPHIVRTTIVGGRPPGIGRAAGPIPRGIEVLVKKAAIDPDFRTLLLEKRAAAAMTIGLALTGPERAMLDLAPPTHLAAIIDSTRVPSSQRKAFLGAAASFMLAAIGFVQAAGCEEAQSAGIRPESLSPSPTPATQPADPGPGALAPRPSAVEPSDRRAMAGSVPAIAAPRMVIPMARPAEPVEVAGARATLGDAARPPATQPAVNRGVRPDLPVKPPATQPAGAPATQPVEAAGLERQVADLVRRLSDDDFNVREKATVDLAALGKGILPILDQIAPADPEAAMRIALVRERLDPKPTPTPVPPEQIEIENGIRMRE